MAHRGPDRVRHWNEGSVALAHLQMRTQVEDAYDRQPLHDGMLTFVCDARIDNREAVAAELGIAAAALGEMADSALIFAAWRKWGKACADRLIGDFVFVVYDSAARTLVLVRDAMGQRHVLVHSGAGFFAFASEKKGLWALPDVPRALPDAKIVRQLLMTADRHDCDPRRPPADGIAAVPGGCILTVSADGARELEQYWAPHADPEHLDKDETYYVAAYRRVLQEAVECRIRRATRAPALFFSGGFDSAAIVGLAAPVLTAQGRKIVGAASVMPAGYSGPFLDSRPGVEMCERFMPQLDVRYVSGEGIDLLGGLDAAIAVNDGAPSPNRYVNDALLRAMAQSGARICMDGHGGDYTLNPNDRKFFIDQLLRGRLGLLWREWQATRKFRNLSHGRIFFSYILMQLVPDIYVRLRRLRVGGRAYAIDSPISRHMRGLAREMKLRPKPPNRFYSKRTGMLNTLTNVQSASWLGFALQSALHGMEFTQPFHDRRVVELALAIPEVFDLKDGKTRYLARKALKDVLPPEFQERLPHNDLRAPDFADMVERALPPILAEIDRMEKAERLSLYFDFSRMRKMFQTKPKSRHALQNPLHYFHAVRALQWARYIEWFNGHNR